MKIKFKRELLFFALLLCGITAAKQANQQRPSTYFEKSKIENQAMRLLALQVPLNYLKHHLK